MQWRLTHRKMPLLGSHQALKWSFCSFCPKRWRQSWLTAQAHCKVFGCILTLCQEMAPLYHTWDPLWDVSPLNEQFFFIYHIATFGDSTQSCLDSPDAACSFNCCVELHYVHWHGHWESTCIFSKSTQIFCHWLSLSWNCIPIYPCLNQRYDRYTVFLPV